MEQIAVKTIRVILTDKEKSEMARELTEKLARKTEITAEKKEAASDFKSQIDTLDKEIGALSLLIHSGYRTEERNCIIEKDFDKKIKFFKDKNTGEIIDQAPFATDDYQKELELDVEKTANWSGEGEENEEEEPKKETKKSNKSTLEKIKKAKAKVADIKEEDKDGDDPF
jgi:hypothetical protein